MSLFRICRRIAASLGIDPARAVITLRSLPWYLRDYQTLRRQAPDSQFKFSYGMAYPCLGDRHRVNGATSGHYFHQDLLVAQRVFQSSPKTHVDIGSRVDGFIAHVASFRKIIATDIRELDSTISNVEFMQLDLMKPLREDLIGFCDSLSCLHTIEHFGLGRYGDPICYDGYLLGLANMVKLLAVGGVFYFSTPIGPQRIEFNAHRVFSVKFLAEILTRDFSIAQFSYVDDDGQLHADVEFTEPHIAENFGCNYGCGIFELRKNP